MTTDVFMSCDEINQPLHNGNHDLYEKEHPGSETSNPREELLAVYGLDRTSLPLLNRVIDALEDDGMFEEANAIIDNLADHQQIRKFVQTLFKHADDGFVQLRMFVDDKDRGDRESLFGYPWSAVHVGNLDKLAEAAGQAACYAARSPKKVNFCPPVATFTGTDKATEDNLCQGLAIMVELDERPDLSRQKIEALLGKPTIAVKSGGTWTDPETDEIQDRCHLYWRLSKPVSGNDTRLKQCRAWASDLVSSDPTGKPVVHPLRWPGSWHKKGEPRLCRISEINEMAEIDIETAYMMLKEAAARAGLRVEQPEIRPRPEYKTNPDADWSMDKPGPQAILARYLSRSAFRRSALMGFASGTAMSALHAGYDLSISELAGVVEDAHHANPSTSKRTRKEFTAIAKDALDWANQHVNQPAHIKKAGWEAYLQSEVDRFEREVREADEIAEAEAAMHGDAVDFDAGDDEPDEMPKTEQESQTPAADADENDDAWPEPCDIFGALTHLPSITPDMFPEAIRRFVYDQAELLGCDPGAMGVTALVVCSALISDGIKIQPRRHNSKYLESARLWLILIGLISNKKSPMLSVLTEHIRFRQAHMKLQYDSARERYNAQLELYQAKRKNWVRINTSKSEGACEEPPRPEKPREKRLLTNDFTHEVLADILSENPRGIMLFMDEIMTLFGGFDAYKAGKVNKDRPTTLELYNGGPRDIDRKSTKDDRLHVPNWSACIVGGIQYSKLGQIGEKLGDDGLLQRFILMPMEARQIGVDRVPDAQAVEAFEMMLDNLIDYDPQVARVIHLSEEAQEYRERIDQLSIAFDHHPGVSEAFTSHAGKWGGHFARLVLTLHIIQNHRSRVYPWDSENAETFNTVSAETARQAFDLMTKFLIPLAVQQYERLYNKPLVQEIADTKWFAGHILAHKLGKISLRNCQRASRTYNDEPARATKALDTLAQMGWLRDRIVNPKVHTLHAERAEYERKTRAERLAKFTRATNAIDKDLRSNTSKSTQ